MKHSFLVSMVFLLLGCSFVWADSELNFSKYCQRTYGENATATPLESNAYGWLCHANGTHYPIDMNLACQQQYGKNFKPHPLNMFDAYSNTCTDLSLDNYVNMAGVPQVMLPWKGRSLAIMTPTFSCSFSTMNRILDVLQRAGMYYKLVTGRVPAPNKTYEGLPTIAVENHNCGAGCSYVGSTGVEIEAGSFQEICKTADEGAFDQLLFYELARNYWFYGNKLEYGGVHAEIAGGFASLMRFLSMENMGISMAPYQGVSAAEFRAEVEKLVDTYAEYPLYSWRNTLARGQGVANPMGLGASDLLASFMLRLRRVHGEGFIREVWKKVAMRPDTSVTSEALDNWVIASSQAVSVNLGRVFSQLWKIPVSEMALDYLQEAFGNPVDVRKYK